MLTYFVALCFITAFFSLFAGSFVYLKNRKGALNSAFALLCLSAFIWSGGLGFEVISSSQKIGFFWSRFLHMGVIFITPTYLHVVVILVGLYEKKKRILSGAYVIAFILFFCNFTNLLVEGVSPKLYFNYYTDPGMLYPLLLLLFFSCMGYGFYLLAAGCRRFSGFRRNQIKYFLIATLMGYVGGTPTYLPVSNIFIHPFYMCLLPVYYCVLAYSIVKYRLMDINIMFTKGIVYILLLLLSSATYLGLAFSVDKIFSQYSGYNSSMSHLLIFLLLIAGIIHVTPQLKIKTEKAVEKVLFKNKYLYRIALQKFGNRITYDLSQEKLLSNTVSFISKVMQIPYVSIMVKNEIYGHYTYGASVGFDDDEIKGLEFAEDSELVNWLSDNKAVLIKDEMEKILPLEKTHLLGEDMDRVKACLCIPLYASVDVIGFLCLSERAANEIYSHIDIGLLQSIAGQISLVIAYKRLEDHMLQTEKLASLGTLAAGLAHEIKNPLSSIQIFAQLFPQKYNDEEFRNKFNRVVVRDVLRISKLIDNVLSLTKSKPAEVVPHDINDIVDDTLSLLNSELLKNKVKVIKSYGKLPLVNCNNEELKQVFLNIIINAMHAMPDGGTLKITSTLGPLATSRSIEKRRIFARIKIEDSGCGIEEKVLNKLFDPFFTTRAEGTGLGLALAHRIIKQHRGFIGVESKLGEGTVFWIDLPVVRGET